MSLTLSDIANQAQRQASNPFISAWVSASAGSGKTKVLTDRVLQLLLVGNAPETILCLTFTKAAAAEMSNRLSKTLRDWLGLDSASLMEKLKNLTGLPENDLTDKVDFARTLFAKVLDAKGGMKIMTIHSFCQNILKRFPLEAGISPSFEIAEPAMATELLNNAIKKTLQNQIFAEDLYILSEYLDEPDLLKLLSNIRKEQSALQQLLDKHISLSGLKMKIYESLGVCVDQNEEYWIRKVYQGDDFETFKLIYLTKDGKKIRNNILEKGSDEQKATAEFLLEILDKIKALKTAQATSAFLNISFEVMRIFDELKENAGVLDYTDLILKTRSLLEEKDMASWVLYKLDSGIDHILLDEAQDTSPEQWAIIRAICEEFFSGEGIKADKIRTMFAVGDKKQSIYRFQGADADEFEKMRLFFTKKITDSQNIFKDVPLNISFRSTQAVLDMVNLWLRTEVGKKGVLSKNEDGTHFAFREGQAGLVEIWPIEPYEKNEKQKNAWDFHQQSDLKVSSVARLSAKIAQRIDKMLQEKEILVSQNRPIRPSDIMILVRSRDRQNLVSELVRALKKKNIPLAGVDRLILNQHIAIMDLISLGAFLLLPEDDLSLAEVLKSPLFGISEEELFDLAAKRGINSLWSQLPIKQPEIYEKLKDLLAKADTMPPFEFYSYLLDVKQFREKFLSRLGAETNEMLDEFLNLALNFERNHSVSLEGFLHYLKKDDIEIQRDLDNSEINAVRIMTVHGSKGLQSNIVFLPDSYSKTSNPPDIIWNKDVPIWIPKADIRTKQCNMILSRINEADDEEYNRLLYVALTRAQDRLYICGFETGKQAPSGNWYDMLKASLPSNIEKIECAQTVKLKNEIKEDVVQEDVFKKPVWFDKLVLQEPTPSKPLSPSKLSQEEPSAPSPLTPEQEKAMQRGTFIHKVLQYLPQIAGDEKAEFIKRLTPNGIEPPLELINLIENKSIKALFGSDSLAEIPVIGTTLDGRIISGQIDRLVVTENEVLIIDYKTNRYPPTDEKDIPKAYIEQMNAYKDLLKNIFNDKVIKCFLLWTTTLTLMEIK